MNVSKGTANGGKSASVRGWWRYPSTVLALLLPWVASAESQPFVYVLTVDGRAIGKREAEIRYLPAENGEVRLFQAMTEFTMPLTAGSYHFKQRLGGRLGEARSFTSSIEDNGQEREVQGFLSTSGEWVVTVVDRKGARTWNLDGNTVDMTSLEFLDPTQGLRILDAVINLRVLATESGAILDGPVERLQARDMNIGGQTVLARCFRWSPPGGRMTLCFEDRGYLLGYQVDLGGRTIGAELESLPPERTYGSVIEVPGIVEQVEEEEL